MMVQYNEIFVQLGLIIWKGGSLKRSLGMALGGLTIPKTLGFEAATQLQEYHHTLFDS